MSGKRYTDELKSEAACKAEWDTHRFREHRQRIESLPYIRV